MLQSMRNHSQSFIIYIIFGVLIFVFAFSFGLPTTQCGAPSSQIVGETADYELRDVELRAAIGRTFGGNLPNTEDELKAVQRQVAYNMLTTLLLAEDAEEAGLRVSDEELRDYITNWERGNPDAGQYLVGGNQFDRKAYEEYLDYTGASIDNYERYKRRELLARRYLTLLRSSIVVPEVEIRDAFDRQNAETNLDYVKLEPRHVEHLFPTVTDAEVATFLEQNMDRVKTYYDENNREFSKPGTVHLKEILVQKNEKLLREVGTETDKEAAPEDRFETVKKAVLEDNMDFDEAVTKYNEALINRESGDRGVEELENISQKHREAVEGKAAGDVVAFETDLTFNLVKILDREEAVSTSLDQVQSDIARKLIRADRAEARLSEAAAEIHEKVAAGSTLQEAVDRVLYLDGDKDEPAPAPAPGDEAPTDGQEPTETGDATPPTEPADGTDTAEAEAAAGDVGEAAGEATAEAAEAAGDDAAGDDAAAGDAAADDDAAADAQDGEEPTTPEAPARPLPERVQVAQTGPFNLNQARPGALGAWSQLPGIGDAPKLARAAMAATDVGKPLPEVYTLEDGSFVVAVLNSQKTPSDEDFATQRDRLERQLAAVKERQLLGDWQSLLSLRHPSPLETPYGAWIQARFEAARTSGDFKINADFL